MSLNTPVALIIFNRPALLEQVLLELAKVRPPQLLVIADGPRTDAEAVLCQRSRDLIDRIDWPCDVRRNYSEANLGCRRRISSGISWVLDQHEEAIFVEDDCLPDPTFFRFTQEMLAHYRHAEQVRAISGDNFQFGNRFTPYSYYFSLIPHCWGWATWRRAWAHMDVTMRDWPALRQTTYPRDLLPSDKAVAHCRRAFNDAFDGKVNSWAIPWEFSTWRTGGLAVLPEVNLVTNIGFGPEATHCKGSDPCANAPRVAMEFPLRHPPTIKHQLDADLAFYERTVTDRFLERNRAA